MINMYEVSETNKMIEQREPGCPHDHSGNQPVGLYGF